jgi:exonuclease SbcD
VRLLHTSDWHLGRSFGQYPLLADQAEFLAWLAEAVEEHRVDLVVVAGDVFDRAVAPAAAVSVLRDGLTALRRAGAEVAMIAGNHDSAERLAAYDGLTDASGVLIRGGYPTDSAPVIRSYRGDDLAIVAVPFLDPLLAPEPWRPAAPTDGGRANRASHESVLRHALDQAREQLPDGVASLAMAHAYVAGSSTSDSERELTIGTASEVHVDCFDGFTYAALGHLHRPQQVGEGGHVRYSGTPLPYSFSERHDKEVVLVDLTADAPSIERLAVPGGRRVTTVQGRLHELVETDPDPETQACFVRVELTDPTPVLDARRRLDAVFDHLVEITRIGPGDEPTSGTLTTTASEAHTLEPLVLAKRFWSEVRGDEPDETAVGVLAEIFAEAEREAAES